MSTAIRQVKLPILLAGEINPFEPQDMLEATVINGITHDFACYDPHTAHALCRAAIADERWPLAWRLYLLLGSLAMWKKPFADCAETQIVLDEMDEALQAAA